MTKSPAAQPRIIRPLRWALGSVAIGSLAATLPAHAAELSHAGDVDDAPIVLAQAGEGGEGGEAGEGGGSGGLGGADAAYLEGLGLIEGHLRAAMRLKTDGHDAMAATHAKHPGEEIYTDLVPQLAERDAAGFAPQLETLAQAIESGASTETVQAAYDDVLVAIAEARSAVDDNANAALLSLPRTPRIAAEEYSLGVVGGKIDNMHEYQDAWGFIETAKAQAALLASSSDTKEAEAARNMARDLEALDIAFPTLVPDGAIETDANVLYGTAARMEIDALGAGG